MHLILTGATGLVGSAALHQMLLNEAITSISILSRRAVPQAAGHEEKAHVLIHNDYKHYDDKLLAQLRDAHGVVWAQGISQTKVSKPEYYDITHDYPLAFARAMSDLRAPAPFVFVYVSGEGATQKPGLLTQYFGVVKGQTEQALVDLMTEKPNLRVYNVRPGGVDWRAHPEIHAFIPPQYTGANTVLSVVGAVWKGMVTPTRQLGRVLTELAMGRGEPVEGADVEMGGRVVTNRALRRMAGL